MPISCCQSRVRGIKFLNIAPVKINAMHNVAMDGRDCFIFILLIVLIPVSIRTILFFLVLPFLINCLRKEFPKLQSNFKFLYS